jgi:hypothetical protein
MVGYGASRLTHPTIGFGRFIGSDANPPYSLRRRYYVTTGTSEIDQSASAVSSRAEIRRVPDIWLSCGMRKSIAFGRGPPPSRPDE